MDTKDVIIHDSSEDTQPEKYGRTLARDAEILKGGGIPDMASLTPTAPAERLVVAPPTTTPSSPRAHMFTPPLVTPIETYSSKERLVAASPITPTQPIPTPPVENPPHSPPAHPLTPPLVTPIETYAGDFLEMVKETHASSATVLAAEQDKEKRSPVPQESREHSRGNLLYIIAGAVLLIAGGAGAYIAYTRYLSALTPVVSLTGVSSPIFVDEREQVSGTGVTLRKAVETSVARPLAPNAVRLLYSAGAPASIFSTLLAGAPDILLRNMKAESSMAGIVNAGGSKSVFFILSVSSYSNTFSGMLFWEKSMPRDLAALWGAYPSLSTSATSSPATTTATRTPNIQTGFHDEVIGNHDARVYRDSAGRSVFLYGYWNQTTLVIARDPGAFIEILQRLATSRAQ